MYTYIYIIYIYKSNKNAFSICTRIVACTHIPVCSSVSTVRVFLTVNNVTRYTRIKISHIHSLLLLLRWFRIATLFFGHYTFLPKLYLFLFHQTRHFYFALAFSIFRLNFRDELIVFFLNCYVSNNI